MINRDKLIELTNRALQAGYKPPVRPACAAFVSDIIQKSGTEIPFIVYVPHFFDLAFLKEEKNVLNAKAGDIIVFKETYDAVPPKGIGPEDDKTHIGIMVTDSQFVHYSSTSDRPVLDTLQGFWLNHFECLLKYEDVSNEFINIKLFYHPNTRGITLVSKDGNVKIHELLLNVFSRNLSLAMTSHAYENNPACRVNDKIYRVAAMEWHIKLKQEE